MTAVLWVHAHPSEGDPVATELPRCLCLGTGKTAAAVSLTRALLQVGADRVVAFGVAGAYRGSGLDVGDVCLVGRDELADEGVEDERGFHDLAAMDLGQGGPYRADDERTARLARMLGGIPIVRAATVSTCSATDRACETMRARTGAAIETMEGAAIAHASEAASVPWIQLRAISNRTGDRARAGWDLPRALTALHAAVRTCSAALRDGAGARG